MTAQLAICQNGSKNDTINKYPKKLIVKGDTIVAFTESQAKKIQLTKIQLDEQIEFTDSLKTQIKKDSLLIFTQNKVIKSYDRERELSLMVIKNDSLINKEYEIQINKLESNLKRARTGNKIFGGAALTGLGILLGILISK